MAVYAFFFYLLALTSSVGAGYLLWATVLQRLSSGEYVCTRPSLTELGTIGLLAIGILATLVNFVAPVSQWLSAFAISVFFVAGIVRIIKTSKPGLLKLLVTTAVITLFSFWGAKFILSYDAGLYHLQAISWMKDETIVFGLANLHDRFGFNSLMFSALAIFWLPFYEVKGLLLANYLPAILTVLILLNHLLNTQRTRYIGLSVSTLFALFCIASLSAIPTLILSNTSSTDLAPNTYIFLSALLFLRSIEDHEASADEVFKNHVLLWVVAVFAILTKLSAVAPGLLALIYSVVNRNTLGTIALRRMIYFLAGVTCVWLLRNFILSGCFIYPLGFTCADTNLIYWGVGSDSADWTQASIEWWAKTPRADIPLDSTSQQWFWNWLQASDRGGKLAKIGLSMMGLPNVVLLYLLYLFAKKRKNSSELKGVANTSLIGLAWVLLAATIGLLFGFLTAPDPRFWLGSLITLIILLPITAITCLYNWRRVSIDPLSVSPIILGSLIWIGSFVLLLDPKQTITLHLVKNNAAVIPEIQTKSIHVSGLIVRAPINDDRCWLAPKPCSPVKPLGLNLDHVGRYSIFSKIRK